MHDCIARQKTERAHDTDLTAVAGAVQNSRMRECSTERVTGPARGLRRPFGERPEQLVCQINWCMIPDADSRKIENLGEEVRPPAVPSRRKTAVQRCRPIVQTDCKLWRERADVIKQRGGATEIRGHECVDRNLEQGTAKIDQRLTVDLEQFIADAVEPVTRRHGHNDAADRDRGS